MSVSLQKGQKIDLTKGNSGLNKIVVGLGWDERKAPSKGFLGGLFGGGGQGQAIDCDASAIMCQNGKFVSNKDLVYYAHLTHGSNAVKHMGDNLTGAGEGDDEQIVVELKNVPAIYDKIIFVVNIYQAVKRNQHFGLIENAFIRIVDSSTNQEICRYNLSENYDNMYAMVFGEVYRSGSEWKFTAIGQPTQDGGLDTLVKRFI